MDLMGAGGNESAQVFRGCYNPMKTGVKGKIIIDLCKDFNEEEERSVKVKNFEIQLDKKFVNRWFGTTY
jgi:hypothetical protein